MEEKKFELSLISYEDWTHRDCYVLVLLCFVKSHSNEAYLDNAEGQGIAHICHYERNEINRELHLGVGL